MSNFFSKLYQKTKVKEVLIKVIYQEDGTANIAIAPKSNVTDDAINKLIPLRVTGKDFTDDEFIEKFSQPIAKTSEMIDNIEQYNARKQEAEKQTQKAKDLQNKIKSIASDIDKTVQKVTDKENYNKFKKHLNKQTTQLKELDANHKALKNVEELIKLYSQNELF